MAGSGGVLSPCRLGSAPVGPVGPRVGGAGEGVSLLLTCAFIKCSSTLTLNLSYLQRLYRSGDAESLHRYTLIPDHPDFARARLNALHLSDVSEPAVSGKEDLGQTEHWTESGTNRVCGFVSLSLPGLSFLNCKMGMSRAHDSWGSFRLHNSGSGCGCKTFSGVLGSS